ncbi:uroporphyrinogen-III synthase [Microcella alkalica]|uniref:Uroporphyrinogen-III synthase n=1 Tax=Microcella alkalica TaxID=355930 RepID=A0A839ECR9_9MICO|nr:uroporphyrinogen-III synthase [Microcella alkalica]MBA8847125.1 uroporphyrinogen-III synthase [Microcella alkalica]
MTVTPMQQQHLAGCRILITADRRSTELAVALGRHGAQVSTAAAISVVPVLDDDELIAATRRVIAEPPDAIVVTTGIGFRGWVEAADAHGLADDLVGALRSGRIVARGPKARGAIQQAGLVPDWVSESETSAELGAYLLDEGVEGLRIVVQHHGSGSDGLDEAFVAAGARVDPIVVYRWGPPKDPGALRDSVRECAAGRLDGVVFTSAPGAQAWLDAATRAGVDQDVRAAFVDGPTLAAAVGPVTAMPLLALGVDPLVPDRGRLGSLVRAVVTHYAVKRATAIRTVAGPLQVRATAALLDDRDLELTPTVLAILRALARANGDVVVRDELLTSLPGDSRDPHAVEVAIARLRQAARDPRVVRTVVKRGYRLELADA